jgi:chlorite dismutase
MSRITEINDTLNYTNFTSFKMVQATSDAAGNQKSFDDFIGELERLGVTLRGVYDLRGFRGDSELLLWLHGPQAEAIQLALRYFRKSEFGKHFDSFWSGMGMHRPAEFNRSHVPGYLMGKPAQTWLSIYPFVRSFDWYLLEEGERREMLIEHGVAGQKYPNIVSNTVASFALGDYEWLLALESNELYELVDMMRDLRYTKARMHVREETPFFTGQKIHPSQIGETF